MQKRSVLLKITALGFLSAMLLLCLSACGGAARNPSVPSSSAPQTEAAADTVKLCQDFLRSKDPSSIETILNRDAPEISALKELPDSYCKINASPGRAPYTKVSFFTTADGLLGPIEFYIDDTGTLIGQAWRE